MTFQEIIEKCEELEFTLQDYGYGEFDNNIFGTVEEVYSTGGMGKGENWERVYHFVDHDIYLSMSGYYQSYSGVDFDGYSPVQKFPKQKTITVYE